MAIEEHVNTLKNKFVILAGNADNAFHPIDVGPFLLQKDAQPFVEGVQGQIAGEFNADRRDIFLVVVVVMMMVMFFFVIMNAVFVTFMFVFMIMFLFFLNQVWIDLQSFGEIERPDIQDLVEVVEPGVRRLAAPVRD